MSDQSEKKAAENPSDEAKREEFVKAVKEGGEEGLKKAFGVLIKSKDALTARVDWAHFQLAVTTRGVRKLPLENVEETITKQGEFNCAEFVRIIKFLEKAGEADQTNKIYEKLKAAEEGQGITLYGEEGVGKTWMAREVAALALRDNHFDAAIWVFLNRDYTDLSLRESIAYQLSVLAEFEEAEAKEAKEKKKEKADEAKKKEPRVKATVQEITRKHHKMEVINKAINGKRVLFILDSEGSRMDANVSTKRDEKSKYVELELKAKNVGGLELKVKLRILSYYKVLITRREGNEGKGDEMKVKPFTWEYSKALAAQAMVREEVAEKNEAQELAHYFMFMSESFLPSHVLLITRIVSYFAKEGDTGLQKLRDHKEMVKNGGDDVRVLDVLIKGYSKLPKSVLIDAYSPEKPEEHFLWQGRKVNFNALICYWIMEGHLGHFDRVEDAYMEGHRVLMELMNCGLLQKQEADYIVASGATKFHLDIIDYKDFFSAIRPGLAVTFDMRLGRVALADGMIRTIGKSDNVVSTLFLDGNRISEEENPAKSLSEHKEEVEVLAINEPTSQHFELPILEMRKLRLLALRGCQFLDNLEHFLWKKSEVEEEAAPKPEVNPGSSLPVEKSDPKPEVNPGASRDRSVAAGKLESLTVVEISGPSIIKTIPDHIFSLTPNLKTLNLSYLLKVELLPNSFYQLTQIEFLILRGCESLRELKSLKNFKDLKILDVSNATSFEKFEDKSLHANQKLQILNLSNTKLKTLPLINQLKGLKFVWLRDCPVLPRIRKIDKMESLKILDIAGAVEVERFCDPSLEDLSNLVIVDISRTAIKRLPANVGDPTYLYAKNCSKIRVVPPVEGLQKLQVLHLSGCDRLREIRHEFFDKVKGLRELDLSRTRVNNLPFLSSLVSLRRLLLSECESLNKLEKLSNLKDLEFLDLSGCKALMELEDGTFEKMIHLQYLDLSRTGLGGQENGLPSLSELKSLKTLHVRDCANLTKLSGVDLPSLELLDYSGTVLKSPPTFSNPDPPEVIGRGIESVHTTQLFKNLGATQQSDDRVAEWKFEHGEVSLCKWNISNWRIEAADKLGTPIYGAHFRRLLKECPSFLKKNLMSTFRFLVYPSEVILPRDFKASYIDELGLRDIYFKQVCEEKMERSLEIRGFKNLPTSLKPLVSQAQLVVLFDDSFLRSLLDLGVDRTMDLKACWIERCNELEHVVAVPEKVEKPGETDKQKKIEGDRHKKAVAGTKKEDDQHKNNAVADTKGQDDKQKNADAEKSGDAAKNEADEKRNDKSVATAAETTKGQDDQQKNADAEKSGDASKNEQKNDHNAVAADAEATKGQDDQQKNADAGKSGDAAKNEVDEQKNDNGEKSGESAKSEGEQQKNGVEEKSGEPEKSEGDKPMNAAAAEEKPEELPKSEDDQQKKGVAGGDEQKNAEKTKELAKREGDDQKKNDTTTTEKSKESAENEVDQHKNAEADKSQENEKTQGSSELKINPAENLDKLETLWISDASNLKIILKGDIQIISFKLLKSLYLEYCPDLSALTSSSSQLQSLETLHIKYCQKLKRLFADDNSPNNLDNLRNLQLWGLDSLEKFGCKAPLLQEVRVGQCPLLEHVFTSRLTKEGEVEGMKYENEGHDNLRVLHIKWCDNLKSICESSSQEDVQLEKLTHLELWGLPKLQKVARVRALRVLRVGECPSLKSIVGGGGNGFPGFETMEVRSCERMRTIIDGGESELAKMKKIELLGLPELERLGAKLVGEVEGEVWACPKLEQFIPFPRTK